MESSEPVSAGDDFDIEEIGLAEYWTKTIEKCNAVAGWELDATQKTIDNAAIRAMLLPEKSKKQEIAEKAVAAFQAALGVVDTLGQIVGSAAGTVMGPANQATNAISFVVNAVKNYNAVVAEIADIMEKLAAFLERIDLYVKEGLDKRLNITVYRILDHFLYIMAAIYKLRGNWKNRLSLRAKTLIIGKDPTIKDATARFEILVDRHTHRQMDIIVSDVHKTGAGVTELHSKMDDVVEGNKHIVDIMDKNTASNEQKERLKKITEMLKIEPSRNTWTEAQDQHWTRARAPGSGKWLLDMQEFQEWVDVERDRTLFFVQAEAGYGKSVLSSYIVRFLQTKFRGQTGVFVAYYYFQKDQPDDDAVRQAFRSIIYQIAVLQDNVLATRYAEFAEKACKTDVDTSKISDLWQAYITDTRIAPPVDGHLYIVLDGVDEIELSDAGRSGLTALRDIVQSLQAESKKVYKGLHVRMCLTAREEGFKALGVSKADRVVLGLTKDAQGEVVYPNKSDVDSYVRFRLNNMAIFKMIKNEEVAQILQQLETTLADNVVGDYSKLNLLLDLIAKSIAVEDVKDVAKRAGETRDEIIRAQIKALNQRLTKSEIEEVNEMLIWATNASTPLTVEQYRNLLTLDSERTVLIDLEKQIRDRYSLFDVDESNIVTLRYEEWFATAKDEDTGTVFDKGEVDLVHRLLRTHFSNISGNDELYKKYNFDGFFKDILSTDVYGIHVPRQARHDHMAQICITALSNNTKNDFTRYARKYFLTHLAGIDQDTVDKVTKKAIDESLVAVLQDVELINTWLGFSDRWLDSCLWTIIHSENLSNIARWVRAADVADRSWLDIATAEGQPPAAVLSIVAKCQAQHWLNLGKEWRESFDWLKSFCMASDISLTPSVKTIALWTKQNIDTRPEQWDKCLANTFLSEKSYTKAVKRFRRALALEPGHQDLQLRLTDGLEGAEQYEEATEMLEEMLASSTRDNELDEKILTRLAECHIRLRRFGAAIPYLNQLMDKLLQAPQFEVPTAGKVVALLIQCLFESQRYDEIMSTLAHLSHNDWLVTFLTRFSHLLSLHIRIYHAAAHTGHLEELSSIYQEAIETAYKFDELWLTKNLGLRVWSQRSYGDRKDIISFWEKCLSAYPVDNEYIVGYTGMADVLSTAYLDLVRNSGWDEALIEEYSKKMVDLEKYYHDYRDDPTILVARMYHLAGNEDKARQCIRAYLGLGFELVGNQDSQREGLLRVAAVLQAMDDDINAVAAWQLIKPVAAGSALEIPVKANAEEDPNQEELQESKDVDSLSLESDDDTTPRGRTLGTCDGDCEKQWYYVGQHGPVYCCKDCIDVQFEPECFRRLKNNTLLERKCCSPDHSHLMVPALREEQWSSPQSTVWVGDKLLHRDEWIESIKVAWELDEKSLRERFEKQKTLVRRVRRRQTGNLDSKDTVESKQEEDNTPKLATDQPTP